jgi:HEAT repeat protein
MRYLRYLALAIVLGLVFLAGRLVWPTDGNDRSEKDLPAWLAAMADRDPACRPDVRALMPPGANLSAVVGLLADALRDSRPAVRAAAAEALGQIGPAAQPAVSGLLDLTRDPEVEPRRRAAEALGRVDRQTSAAAGVLVPLLDDPATSVRLAAVQSLGQLGQSARMALPALLQIQNDPDRAIRRAAMVAITAILCPEPGWSGGIGLTVVTKDR